MKPIQKLVLLKTAWCDWYDGDEVTGNFGYVEEHGPSSGHERFNFRRTSKGVFHGYIPPIGKHHSLPNPPEPNNWTVVWVSKKPGTSGVRIVGVYFDASFDPEGGSYKVAGETIGYCVTARDGFVVPPELRTEAFKSPIKSGPCFYLRGGDKDSERRALANYLSKEIVRLLGEAEAEADILTGHIRFPSSEHIRKVEKAAIDFVWKHFESRRHTMTDRQKDNVGYDLEAVSGKTKLLLEVKGTSGSTPYAYITANERAKASGSAEQDWRMCMVTQALTAPTLTILTAEEFLTRFSLEAVCYRAVLKQEVVGDNNCA